MKLTNEQAVLLHEAIGALDGGTTMQLIEGKLTPVPHVYQLGAAARWALARAAGELEKPVAAFNAAKNALLKEHSGGTGKLEPQDAGYHKFMEEFEGLKQMAGELNLPANLSLADLKLEVNAIPIRVLAALKWLIVEG